MQRLALLVLAGLAMGASTAMPARAQDFPTRQITLIAPWPAGGAVDALCRAVAQPLSERLGKSVVVENRPGAGSVIGTAAGAKAAPDGYTMVMAGSGSLAISATMYKKLPYDPVKDFIPITLGGRIPFILVVTPSLPVHSVAELVAYAKDNPGKLSFASGGPGSPHHLYGELLKSMTGIEMTHVPYKGSAPALTDVIAGHVPLLFSDTVPSLPQIREGKVRALGVSTAVRLPSAPEIPPIAEAGVPGFDAAGWGVFSVPAGTPKEVVSKLETALNSVLALPEVQQQIIRLGMIPGKASSPEELQRFIEFGDRALGQGRAASRAGGDGVAPQEPRSRVPDERATASEDPGPRATRLGARPQRPSCRPGSRLALARNVVRDRKMIGRSLGRDTRTCDGLTKTASATSACATCAMTAYCRGRAPLSAA